MLPKPKKNEEESTYMARCMDFLANEDKPNEQKVAMCLTTFRSKDGESQADIVNKMDFTYCTVKYLEDIELGFEEDLTTANFYIPKDEEYEDFGETTEEVSAASLWENIRKKKERMGKKYKPAKPGDKDRPDPKAWKKAQSKFKYKNMKTGEVYVYDKRGDYSKDGQKLFYLGQASMTDYMYASKEEAMKFAQDVNLNGVFTHTTPDGKTYWMPGRNYEEFEEWCENQDELSEELSEAMAAEYQGRKVTLNKPFRTPSGPKKFAVYTKNESGNVVVVRFGDKNLSIKRDDPERRRSFRARHKCDTNPGPKWKAKFWSCRQWRANAPVED